MAQIHKRRVQVAAETRRQSREIGAGLPVGTAVRVFRGDLRQPVHDRFHPRGNAGDHGLHDVFLRHAQPVRVGPIQRGNIGLRSNGRIKAAPLQFNEPGVHPQALQPPILATQVDRFIFRFLEEDVGQRVVGLGQHVDDVLVLHSNLERTDRTLIAFVEIIGNPECRAKRVDDRLQHRLPGVRILDRDQIILEVARRFFQRHHADVLRHGHNSRCREQQQTQTPSEDSPHLSPSYSCSGFAHYTEPRRFRQERKAGSRDVPNPRGASLRRPRARRQSADKARSSTDTSPRSARRSRCGGSALHLPNASMGSSST